MGVIANRGIVLPGMPLSARAWVQVFLNGMAFPPCRGSHQAHEAMRFRSALAAGTHAFILSRLGPQ